MVSVQARKSGCWAVLEVRTKTTRACAGHSAECQVWILVTKRAVDGQLGMKTLKTKRGQQTKSPSPSTTRSTTTTKVNSTSPRQMLGQPKNAKMQNPKVMITAQQAPAIRNTMPSTCNLQKHGPTFAANAKVLRSTRKLKAHTSASSRAAVREGNTKGKVRIQLKTGWMTQHTPPKINAISAVKFQQDGIRKSGLHEVLVNRVVLAGTGVAQKERERAGQRVRVSPCS